MKDTDDPENGDAFYFQTNYDKVVAVPGDALPGGVGTEKRSAYDIPADWFGVKATAEAYDKFWFCYFNNTFLEGFIYPDKGAAIPTQISSTTSMPSATKTSGTTSSQTATGASYWPTYLPEITQAPGETITTTMTLPSTTCTYTGVASALPAWLKDKYPDDLEMGDDSPPARKLRRGDDDVENDDDDDDMPYDDGSDGTPPPYPYLMKFEERRLPDAPAPYCVQYQVLVGGEFNTITHESDGSDVVIQLTEFEDDNLPGSPRNVRRGEETGLGTCHCQWMVGE